MLLHSVVHADQCLQSRSKHRIDVLQTDLPFWDGSPFASQTGPFPVTILELQVLDL